MPTIRRATSDDLEDLRVLLRETWHATYDEFYGVEEVERLTAGWHSIEAMEARLRKPDGAFLVATENERVVGMTFAAEEEFGLVCLHQLYVLPDAQGRGIGGSLFDAALEAFPTAERLRLDVEIANRRAVAFYERRGLQTLGLEADVDAPRMVRMERRLDACPAVDGLSADPAP